MTKLIAFTASHSSLKTYENTDYQKLACEVAKEVGIGDALCMDDHDPSPDLERRCRQSVQTSDILILILGWRYGALHDGNMSLTEIEYETALNTNKEILVLIQDVPQPTDPDPVELQRAIDFRKKFDGPGNRPLYRTFVDRTTFEKTLRAGLLDIIRTDSYRVLNRNSEAILDRITSELADLIERNRTRVSRSAMITVRKVDPLLGTIPESMRRFAGIEDDPADQIVTERQAPADGCFPEHGRLIVKGEFGSGKTNFLELLQFKAATRLCVHPNSSRVPLRLDLGQWQPELQTFRIFVDAEATKAFGNRVACDDLVLFLDEIDNREQSLDSAAIGQIANWLSRHRWAWAAVAVRQLDGIAESLLKAKPDLEFKAPSASSFYVH